MGRPGLLIYFDLLPAFDALPVESTGKLLLAALHYAQSGKEPVFDDEALKIAWAFICPAVDRDGASYEEKRARGEWLTYCRQCKRDGTEPLGFEDWQRVSNGVLHTETEPLPSTSTTQPQHNINPESTTDYIGADKPPKPTRFVPPTVDEVSTYCRERHSQVDPEKFCDFYISNGWMVGKNKMRDWKAAVRTWEKGSRKDSVAERKSFEFNEGDKMWSL